MKKTNRYEYVVVHPLDDIPEKKCQGEHLERLQLTTGTKAAFLSLQVYLVAMLLLITYRVIIVTINQ